VQFIAVVVHATRPPIQDPQTFANAQSHITDFDSTRGYSPENLRLFDLTQAEYPIVWRNEGDWDRYVGAYYEFPYSDPMGQVRTREEPDLPGIAIIDLTHVSSPRGPREPGTPSGGTISAVRSGYGAIVGHDIRSNGRLQGFSNLNATSHWIDRQISQILGNPSTFTYNYLIAQVDSNVLRRFIGNLIETRIGKEFQAPMENYLLAYLQKGVKPPAAIAPAILNMADDYLNGRTMDLRAGDYFAIQRHFNLKKSL
jgi:hypothetical protein